MELTEKCTEVSDEEFINSGYKTKEDLINRRNEFYEKLDILIKENLAEKWELDKMHVRVFKDNLLLGSVCIDDCRDIKSEIEKIKSIFPDFDFYIFMVNFFNNPYIVDGINIKTKEIIDYDLRTQKIIKTVKFDYLE